jgi:hypothetical protein
MNPYDENNEENNVDGGGGGDPVTAFGTTIKIWNRSGGTINVEHLGGYGSDAIQNIFFPEKSDPSTYEWNTGYMLELIYLPVGGDMTSPSGEVGIWYKVN